MLRRNPNILLCVECYIKMLRDEVDVITVNNGTIRFRNPQRSHAKAKLAQVVIGQGAKVLSLYHDYAETLPGDSPRRAHIAKWLGKVPTSYYVPEENLDEQGSSGVGDIMARLSKLEGTTAQVRVQTKDGGEIQVGEVPVDTAERDKQRAILVEEWFHEAQLKRASAGRSDEAGDISKQLSLFKAMGAARTI
jgi:hypothetical protein